MPQASKKLTLSGWGNNIVEECVTFRPEKKRDLTAIVKSGSSLIARGQGKSYGDAAINHNGTVLSQRLDKFLSFDSKKGTLSAQSGVTIEEILNIILKKGWCLPVTPGTKYISLGGAVAADVHGKNNYKSGTFSNHIEKLKVLTANGKSIECSPEKNLDLFWATVGGMGMTGIIEEVTVRLKKITSLSVIKESIQTDNIVQMVECFEQAKETHEYTVGWIDYFSGEKGVFEKANHASLEEGGKDFTHAHDQKKTCSVPKCAPSFLLNKYSMRVYNLLRYMRSSRSWKTSITDMDKFLHPLDNLKDWNNLYGRKGFVQYQFVIPETKDTAQNLHDILSFINKSVHNSYLVVVKYHGEHTGTLSFPIKGYSMAFDFPARSGLYDILQKLDKNICELGGRVYLAKDSTLTADIFEKMYKKELTPWRKALKKIDPDGKFNSHMAKRLNFRGGKNA